MSKSNRYCLPHNAGLNSETPAVCRRIGRLIQALHEEINSHIVEGAICEDVREFAYGLQQKLEAEGWSFSYDGGNRLKVRPPEHKKPWPRRTRTEA